MAWLSRYLQLIVLPPTSNLIIILLGILALSFKRWLGWGLIGAGVISLWLLSTPYVANALITRVQMPAKSSPESKPQAIVVLGGGVVPYMPVINRAPRLSSASWLRLRAAASLQRETGLPLLLSGGGSRVSRNTGADLMAEALRDDFNQKPEWIERRSLNTYQNGQYCARYLHENKINSIYLVTSAWHMNRAVKVFESFDLKVTPYPAYYTQVSTLNFWTAWLPSAYALYVSRLAFHEMLGYIWYQLIYW